MLFFLYSSQDPSLGFAESCAKLALSDPMIPYTTSMGASQSLSPSTSPLDPSMGSVRSPLPTATSEVKPVDVPYLNLFSIDTHPDASEEEMEWVESLNEYPTFIECSCTFFNSHNHLRAQAKSLGIALPPCDDDSVDFFLELNVKRLRYQLQQFRLNYESLKDIVYTILKKGDAIFINFPLLITDSRTVCLESTVGHIIVSVFPHYHTFVDAIINQTPLNATAILSGLNTPIIPNPKRKIATPAYTETEYRFTVDVYSKIPPHQQTPDGLEFVLQKVFSRKRAAALTAAFIFDTQHTI